MSPKHYISVFHLKLYTIALV